MQVSSQILADIAVKLSFCRSNAGLLVYEDCPLVHFNWHIVTMFLISREPIF